MAGVGGRRGSNALDENEKPLSQKRRMLLNKKVFGDRKVLVLESLGEQAERHEDDLAELSLMLKSLEQRLKERQKRKHDLFASLKQVLKEESSKKSKSSSHHLPIPSPSHSGAGRPRMFSPVHTSSSQPEYSSAPPIPQ